MKPFRIGIQVFLLTFVLCQLFVLSESRRRKSSRSSRRFDSEDDDDDDRSGDNSQNWEKVAKMKNRLKLLKKSGRRSRESDESSSSDENPSRSMGRGSIFPKRKYESVEFGRYRPKKYRSGGTSGSKEGSGSNELSGSDEISSELGKLFLPKLLPGDISGKFTKIRKGLKRRLKNIVPYCPDLHTVSVLKNWGKMFKKSFPNFFKMGQKSVDYANDLRKQMGKCVKRYVTKQLIKGRGGKNDRGRSDSDRSDRSDRSGSGENDSDERDRLPKSHQITKGADGKNRRLFRGDDDGDSDEDHDTKKREVGTAVDAETLANKFKTLHVEPILEYFEKLPEMISALKTGRLQ